MILSVILGKHVAPFYPIRLAKKPIFNALAVALTRYPHHLQLRHLSFRRYQYTHL